MKTETETETGATSWLYKKVVEHRQLEVCAARMIPWTDPHCPWNLKQVRRIVATISAQMDFIVAVRF